jgi:hypothetical protein
VAEVLAFVPRWVEQLAARYTDGISLVFLPPCSPELQPAERLWPLIDEPVANRHLATLAELDAIVAERCRRLDAAIIRPHTDFHWWPRSTEPSRSAGSRIRRRIGDSLSRLITPNPFGVGEPQTGKHDTISHFCALLRVSEARLLRMQRRDRG